MRSCAACVVCRLKRRTLPALVFVACRERSSRRTRTCSASAVGAEGAPQATEWEDCGSGEKEEYYLFIQVGRQSMEFRSSRLSFRYGITTEDRHSLIPSSGILGINRDLLYLLKQGFPTSNLGVS